ncbi:hypothetical protein M407DRAFT_9217 [Tulasnella calospora MUT 4182]|uniref:Uncharacterized protein n=1 Tax=Tulasnella calospora MUT 4182 TaxID=1051891 RepID=A0A0C3KR73_9AGAM|nr:hypothetical protein M407DRAFT_9217 [Tulasnella calospora MUT 4182]
MAAPGWQTDELDEEWVSPPPSPAPANNSFKVNNSIRNVSSPSVKDIILLSTPTKTSRFLDSANSSPSTGYQDGSSPQGGTFLIREDQPLPETPLGLKPGQRPKKGMLKDFFTPLALERMFEPPSPPATPDLQDGPDRSTTPPLPPSPSTAPRVLSQPTRSLPPSRLSQSFVPPSESDTSNVDGSTVEGSDAIVASDIPGLVAFDGRKASSTFQFTFQVPKTPSHDNANTSRHYSPPNPTPNPRAAKTRDASWGNTRSASHNATDGEPQAEDDRPPSDPPLKLFQFQYDTFTRDHLGALADSIAIRGSPSASHESEDGDEEPVWRSTKRIKLSPPEDLSSRTSSSRDFRNSPWGKVQTREYFKGSQSFARMLNGGGLVPSQITQGPASTVVADRRDSNTEYLHPDALRRSIRNRVSSTSSSASGSTIAAITPVDPTPSEVGVKRNSVNYRLQGANILAQIKLDVLNQSTELSWAGSAGGKSAPSTVSDESQAVEDETPDETTDSILDETQSLPAITPPKLPRKSPRKLLRRLSAADEVERELGAEVSGTSMDGEKSLQDQGGKRLPHLSPDKIVVPPTIVFTSRIPDPPHLGNELRSSRSGGPLPPRAAPQPVAPFPESRRIPSTAPATLHPNHVPASHEDMNRFVSSSTTSGISGTTVGSFVKQPGPPLVGQMRTIRPEEIQGVLPAQLGGMVYSSEQHKWVREGNTVTGDGDTSDDPFGDIESLVGTPRSDRHQIKTMEQEDEAEEEEVEQDSEEPVVDQTQEIDDVKGDDDSAIAEDFDDDSILGGDTESVINAPEPQYDDFSTTASEGSPQKPSNALATPKAQARTLEELSESIANMSLKMDLSPVKPARTPRTPSSAVTRQLPIRSVLKPTPSQNAPLATPVVAATPRATALTASQRRSVSFSDGRKSGKMRDVSVHVPETETEESDRSKLEEDTGNLLGGLTSEVVASARTKRCQDLLEGLNDSDGLNTFATREQSQLKAKSPLPTPQGQSTVDSSGLVPRGDSASRTFSRTTKTRAGEATGETTFLTTEASFRITHEQLVRVLTSIEPYEPYWETLKTIDMRRKGVESLNRLKELMPNLDRIYVDGNSLGWLSGLPSNLRVLSAANNLLTSSTSFAHLLNIEELEISHNQVDSLEQFGALRHLRDLKADGNRIVRLDGIGQLDSLVRVSVKSNCIQEVDFDSFDWPRLEALDLSSNSVNTVGGLGSLPALASLNLDHNELVAFASDSIATKMKILRLSHNRLTKVDLAAFPNLRTLYMDNNRLGDVLNASRLTRLENLSVRSQAGPNLPALFMAPRSWEVYGNCRHPETSRSQMEYQAVAGMLTRRVHRALSLRDVRDIKRLYISGNPLNDRELFPEPMYNLVYLEMAACRLSVLPENMGKMVPNLRVINLNYNFLGDIAKPMAGLSRLRKISAVGSRLKGSKAIVRMLQKMPEMEQVDLRMNPFSLGWYLPIIVHDLHGALQPSERGVSVTGDSDAAAAESNPKAAASPQKRGRSNGSSAVTWQDMDNKFRRDLPDELYVARLGFRGLVMRACPKLVTLDGVEVTSAEKEKAGKLLKGLERSVNGQGSTKAVAMGSVNPEASAMSLVAGRAPAGGKIRS